MSHFVFVGCPEMQILTERDLVSVKNGYLSLIPFIFGCDFVVSKTVTSCLLLILLFVKT